VNIPPLAKLARNGYAILAAVPSCTLMFKSELPLLFPDDPEVKAVSEAMFDPFEYFVLRHRDGLLKTDFKTGLGKVSYHIPCHSRVQNIGQKTREALQLVPGTTLNTVERCAGHDGTWGVKSEYYENSMKIGRPVFRQMTDGDPTTSAPTAPSPPGTSSKVLARPRHRGRTPFRCCARPIRSETSGRPCHESTAPAS